MPKLITKRKSIRLPIWQRPVFWLLGLLPVILLAATMVFALLNQHGPSLAHQQPITPPQKIQMPQPWADSALPKGPPSLTDTLPRTPQEPASDAPQPQTDSTRPEPAPEASESKPKGISVQEGILTPMPPDSPPAAITNKPLATSTGDHTAPIEKTDLPIANKPKTPPKHPAPDVQQSGKQVRKARQPAHAANPKPVAHKDGVKAAQPPKANPQQREQDYQLLNESLGIPLQ